jgi:hypothetical protein
MFKITVVAARIRTDALRNTRILVVNSDNIRSRNSSFSLATGTRPGRQKNRGLIPGSTTNLPLVYSMQTGTEVHVSSGYRGLLP